MTRLCAYKAQGEKKLWNLRWQARNTFDGTCRSMAKVLMTLGADPSEAGRRQNKFAQIIGIKIFAFDLPSQ